MNCFFGGGFKQMLSCGLATPEKDSVLLSEEGEL